MSITKNIRRIIFISIWVLAGAGFVVVLIAAVNARNHQTCQGYEIEIKDADKAIFIDKKDIEKILTANRTIVFKNKPVKSIDLNIIEARLKKESWIKDAEIFFDNNEKLKVIVEQRIPIARMFSSSGGSFLYRQQRTANAVVLKNVCEASCVYRISDRCEKKTGHQQIEN